MWYPSAVNKLVLAFANMDWKRSRYDTDRARANNNTKLHRTITNIVSKMDPDILCMCEVGEAHQCMDEDMMRDFVDTSQNAWKAAAGKHVQLQFLYEVGFPYMTIYRYDKVLCGDQEFLTDLYWAKQAPRTAQHFQCTGPDNLKVDIINVQSGSRT